MTGEYYKPTPLDFRMLELMPVKGILGGVHWAGRPLKHIREDINRDLPDGVDAIPMSVVQSRARSMHVAGLVEDFQSTGGTGKIWARTEGGTELLGRKEEVLS